MRQTRSEAEDLRGSRLDVRPAIRRAVALLFFAVLNWLMLTPAETFEHVDIFFANEDKLAHAAAFFVLALLARWSLPLNCGRGRRGVLALSALLVYGAAIEALQPVLGGAGRLFEWSDLVCNLAGIGAGWAGLRALAAPPAARRRVVDALDPLRGGQS